MDFAAASAARATLSIPQARAECLGDGFRSSGHEGSDVFHPERARAPVRATRTPGAGIGSPEIPADWTPHHREDGELLGWIRPEGADWLAIDVLGRELTGGIDWLGAEAALEERGIRWLAGPWVLEGEGAGTGSATAPLRVQIVEVVPAGEGRITVKVDDFGDMQRPPTQRYTLPGPLPARLRPRRPGDPDGRTITR